VKLAGRVALVTGAGSGIGKATAQRLAAAGMKVCVADVNGDAAASVADEIDGLAVACDVSDAGQVSDAFRRCGTDLGSVDLAVLNAGITIRWSGDIGSLDLVDYRKSLGVNLDGVVFGAVEAVRAMRSRPEQTDAAIVATASLSGLMPWYPDPVYSLGKHGVVGFMRSIAPSLAAEGIAVHTVCPGITATGALGNRRALVEGIGVPVMEPETIAEAIVMAATRPIEEAGTCWVAQHGKTPYPMAFPDLSGPDDPLNRPVTRR
jgi:NAD(P)-dependent dehydrogenase (short-subunit alcohol dehydrogenase family)